MINRYSMIFYVITWIYILKITSYFKVMSMYRINNIINFIYSVSC